MEVLLEDRSETTDDTGNLVRRAQDGDTAAFERLYCREVDYVYALCLRMSGTRKRAERLTQDAFVRAWKKLDSFRFESAFSTWLHRLTVNVVLADARARGRRRAWLEITDDLAQHEHCGGSPSPCNGLDLEKGIAALPDRARMVLVLHDVEGYRHDEIGEMMGIAVGTSKAHLHRARSLLKAMLK